MNLQTLTVKTAESLPIVAQIAAEDETAKAQLAINSELSLVLLGLALLGAGSYMFLSKLCKTLASSGND